MGGGSPEVDVEDADGDDDAKGDEDHGEQQVLKQTSCTRLTDAGRNIGVTDIVGAQDFIGFIQWEVKQMKALGD